MPIEKVADMYRRALEAIGNHYGRSPSAASLAANGAWWFALDALDHHRPPAWLRSSERNAAVERLNEIRDKAIAAVYAAAESTELVA